MPTKQKLRCINARVGTDLSYCRITGIEVLEDGRILLCDNNNDKVISGGLHHGYVSNNSPSIAHIPTAPGVICASFSCKILSPTIFRKTSLLPIYLAVNL
jgi:hypothetical protein